MTTASRCGRRRLLVIVLPVVVAAVFGVIPLFAAPPAPTYFITTPDAITADNTPRTFTHPSASCPAGSPCYLPDPNPAGEPVDSYTGDVYERPTPSGSGASTVFRSLDITSSQVGYDSEYLYYRINLHGLDSGKLEHFHSYEINFDNDDQGDLLVRVANPTGNVGSTWGTSGVIAFVDQNNNMGGASPTLPDGPGGTVDGYEFLAFDQGSNQVAGAATSPPTRGTRRWSVARSRSQTTGRRRRAHRRQRSFRARPSPAAPPTRSRRRIWTRAR